MKAYIKSSAAISPQGILPADKIATAYLSAIEPDYKDIIDPKLSRRMSRIIKMSMAAATKALREAGVEMPAAIIVGTGLGCTADTEKFLKEITINEDGILSPTAFIQSTHNTIAGQIALSLNCPNHNFTFSNRGHSFENALTDAILQIAEGNDDILLGGVDELTPFVFELVSEMDCANDQSAKVLFGEGASFFVLAKEKSTKAVGLMDYSGLNNVSPAEVKDHLMEFLNKNNLSSDDIDVFITGRSNNSDDAYYSFLQKEFGDNTVVLDFKGICGEYFTASAYAMHIGASILKDQILPSIAVVSGRIKDPVSTLLIYNNFAGNCHSFILLSK